MATSSKSRVKASSAHRTASPAASRRTRSTSRPLAEKDSRKAASISKNSSKYASTGSRREPSRYEESKRGKSIKKAGSDYEDDAESVDSDAADRKKRSLLKKQKAQLRAQSPDEDLYQSSSSSSESSSESDGIQVVVQAKRKLVPVVSIPAKPRTSTSKTQNAPSVKSRTDAGKPASRHASHSRPSPANKRRLDSDSISPPPLRVLSSKQAKRPAERPKARPSAPSSAKLPPEEPTRRREKVKASSPPLHSTYRSPKAQQEGSQARPALHPPKRIKTMPSESDSERSITPPAKIVAASSRKPADQHPIARPTAHAPASVNGRKRLPSPSDSESDASDSNASKPLSPPHARAVQPKMSTESRDILLELRREGQMNSSTRGKQDEPSPQSSRTRQQPSPVKTVPVSRPSPRVQPVATSSTGRRLPSPEDLSSSSDEAPARKITPPRKTLPQHGGEVKSQSPTHSSPPKTLARRPAPPTSAGAAGKERESIRSLAPENRRRSAIDDIALLLPSRKSPEAKTKTTTITRREQLTESDADEDEMPLSPQARAYTDQSFSPSEPPESYIGASAQIYIERTTILRTAPQASTSSSRATERSDYVSRSPEASKRSVERNQRGTRDSPGQQQTLSSSPLPPPLAQREDSQSSDEYQASSLTARKSTVSATSKNFANTLPAASNLDSPRALAQREDSQSSDEYQASSLTARKSTVSATSKNFANTLPAASNLDSPRALAQREDSQSSDEYQASSLTARKSTVSATSKSFANTLPAASNLDSPRAARQSASGAPRHSKPFQRITRSSSDEDTADEAASAGVALKSPDEIATQPDRQRQEPREDDIEKAYQRAAEPLREDASHEEEVNFLADEEGGRSDVPVQQRLAQTEAEMDVFVEDEGGFDQLPAMDSDHFAKEVAREREGDIPVPAYRSPSHSPPREDEPRFTATSRIISQPRRSKASKKTNRPEYDYDIDIPVPYDDDAEVVDGRIDENAFTEEDQDEMPRANVKIERVSMSKRARKATGGVPVAKRQSATRRKSRSKRDIESDATTQQSSSESDSFGDNGAIVSDASVRSGYSHDDHQQSKLQRRVREPNSPYTRRRSRHSKFDDEVEDDFQNDVALGKRRKVSHSRPVVLIRPSTTRRSSSAVASNKPTRPSKSGISSNSRHLQVNGSSRRKSLNERFSDEDTEGSDIVEVMKSSTLEEGQSADAVLRAMSREVREKSGDHARLRSDDDDITPRNKGKERASSHSRHTHDNAGLEGEGGADSDASLPPPLRTRSSQSSEMADHNQSVQIDAPEGSPPGLQDAAVFQDDFHLHGDLQDSADFFDGGERVTQADSIAGATATQYTNLHNAPAVNSSGRPLDARAAISSTLHTMMPQEVLDAVQSASSSESRAQSQGRIRSKRGPTPANGKRRRFEEDVDLDEEEEVIVKDSAIVRDPHGRMIRKEEMLESIAEHERNAKGKGRPRASSLEDAEGRLVDEAELAAGAVQDSLANEVNAHLRDAAFVDLDMNLEYVLENDTFDEDEIFNLSIAKFEVQIEEFMEDDEPQASTGLIEVTEGIVEEIEESFWEDEVELFVAQQLLDRHNRRKSNNVGRSAQTPSRPGSGRTDVLNRSPGSSQPGSVEHPIPEASAPKMAKATAVEASQPLDQSDVKATLPEQDESTQLNDMVGRRMSSRSLSPSRGEASSASPQIAMATAEMSPELAIPEMPTRTVPRGTPSKVSPTKGRKHSSPFKQLAEPLRENGILQTAIREGDEVLLVDEEPVIRPSVSTRSKTLPASPSVQHTALPPRESPEILPENSLLARDVSTEADAGIRHARSATPDMQSLGEQSPTSDAKQQASAHGSQRKRRQDNVYVEIQSPIRSSPGRKRVPRSQSPLQPSDLRSPTSMAAADTLPTTLEPTGSVNVAKAITSPELQTPGSKQDENAGQADRELDDVAPEHPSTFAGSSTHVEEINALFDEGLAGIAEELTGTDTTAPLRNAAVPQVPADPSSLRVDETSGATAAEDPASAAMESVPAQIAQTSTLPADGEFHAEADVSTSLVDEGAVETIEVIRETRVEVTEVATVTKTAERQPDPASDPTVTATMSDSDSEGPSEQGVSAPVHNTDTSDGGTGVATTSEDQDTSTSSSDDSPSATSADSSDETSDDAEGEDHDEEAEQPFKLAALLAWVDSLKDEERPHLIGPKGAQKLFEQMNLSTEGALPLLLAWKLDSQNKAECVKADFVSLMRENEIDTPLKLSAYLSTLQTSTFAISSHLRFSSASDDESQSQPKRTWRIPEGYRSFYQFAFDYTTKSGTANTLNTEEARNLWWIVLAPALTPGQDVVNFMDSEAWTDGITKDGWLAMLDACTSANLSKTLEEQEAAGTVTSELIKTYSKWLGDSAGSHEDGRANPTL